MFLINYTSFRGLQTPGRNYLLKWWSRCQTGNMWLDYFSLAEYRKCLQSRWYDGCSTWLHHTGRSNKDISIVNALSDQVCLLWNSIRSGILLLPPNVSLMSSMIIIKKKQKDGEKCASLKVKKLQTKHNVTSFLNIKPVFCHFRKQEAAKKNILTSHLWPQLALTSAENTAGTHRSLRSVPRA